MGVTRALARVPGTQTYPYKPFTGAGYDGGDARKRGFCPASANRAIRLENERVARKRGYGAYSDLGATPTPTPVSPSKKLDAVRNWTFANLRRRPAPKFD